MCKTFHFFVNGPMEKKDEKEKLFFLLENPPDNIDSLNITFYDAKMVDAEMIEKISQFMESSINIKLKVYIIHHYLSGYLMKLGIYNTFIQSNVKIII